MESYLNIFQYSEESFNFRKENVSAYFREKRFDNSTVIIHFNRSVVQFASTSGQIVLELDFNFTIRHWSPLKRSNGQKQNFRETELRSESCPFDAHTAHPCTVLCVVPFMLEPVNYEDNE